MRQNILWIMSLSGTAVFLLYLLLRPVSKQVFSARWHFAVLKASLFFFLSPLPYFKYSLLDGISFLFPALVPQVPISGEVHFDIVLNERGAIMQASPQIKQIWGVMLLCGIITFVFILTRFIPYWRTKRAVFRSAEELASGAVFDAAQQLKDRLKLKRHFRVYTSSLCQTPMVIGVFSPALMLPASLEGLDRDDQELADILRHELIHIKHHDLLTKFLGLLVVAIHWFNPLCYLLYFELCNLSELYCDATVIRGKNEAERKAYCNLILEIASASDKQDRLIPVSKLIGNDAKTLKRRILAMKHTDLKPKKLLACVAGAAIIFSSALTTLAYDPPVIMLDNDSPTSLSIEFTPGSAQSTVLPLPFEAFFTDSNGTIYPITDDGQRVRASCRHSYVTGTATKHNVYSDGSCKVYTYDSSRCSICGYVIVGDLINYTYSQRCPH